MELLLSYISNYGDKMCCYADITQYLPHLPQERIAPFLEKVEGLVNRREDGIPLDVSRRLTFFIGCFTLFYIHFIILLCMTI